MICNVNIYILFFVIVGHASNEVYNGNNYAVYNPWGDTYEVHTPFGDHFLKRILQDLPRQKCLENGEPCQRKRQCCSKACAFSSTKYGYECMEDHKSAFYYGRRR